MSTQCSHKLFSWAKERIGFLLLAVILGVGIYARFAGLAWHFAHFDDLGIAKSIFEYKRQGSLGLFAVSPHWTYAPFQFLITPFLISVEQGYRELLFWGRLPSCLFSIIGLFAFAFFYKQYRGLKSYDHLPALALLVCSWENIIFAKQMHNYALSVTAAIGVLSLLMACLSRKEWTWPWILWTVFLLAVFTSMHYSIMLFMPAFFLTLFIHGWVQQKKVWSVLGRLVSGGFFYLVLIFPLYHFFLRTHIESGRLALSDWNKGWSLEYFFHLTGDMSFGEKIWYTIGFCAKNFFLIFQTNTGFVAGHHFLFLPISIVLFVLFVLGLVSFIGASEEKRRALGLFSFLLLGTWFAAVFAQKFTLSPTRHNMILAPVMAIAIVEGLRYVLEKWRWAEQARARTFLIISAIIVTLFVSQYHVFLDERKDPFDEPKIMELVERYNLDAIFPAYWTAQVLLMKNVRDYFKFDQPGFMEYYVMNDGTRPYKRIAWISHRQKLDPQVFERMRSGLNPYLYITNRQRARPLPLVQYPLAAYNIIHQEEIDSDVQIEFSNRTQNGINGYFVYVLERKF